MLNCGGTLLKLSHTLKNSKRARCAPAVDPQAPNTQTTRANCRKLCPRHFLVVLNMQSISGNIASNEKLTADGAKWKSFSKLRRRPLSNVEELLAKEVVNCLQPSPLGTVCGQAFIPLSLGC